MFLAVLKDQIQTDGSQPLCGRSKSSSAHWSSYEPVLEYTEFGYSLLTFPLLLFKSFLLHSARWTDNKPAIVVSDWLCLCWLGPLSAHWGDSFYPQRPKWIAFTVCMYSLIQFSWQCSLVNVNQIFKRAKTLLKGF